VDNEGNILNVEDHNLYTMKNDGVDQANFVVTFSKNLIQWSSTILTGIDNFLEKKIKIDSKET
jgi:hypothetical protein